MGQRAQGNRPLDMGFTHGSRKDMFMVQVAAVFLFALSAGLGLTVFLAMLKSNGAAILSALLGDGDFPAGAAHLTGHAPAVFQLRASPPPPHPPSPGPPHQRSDEHVVG